MHILTFFNSKGSTAILVKLTQEICNFYPDFLFKLKNDNIKIVIFLNFMCQMEKEYL